MLDDLERRHATHAARYEDLRADTLGVVQNLCAAVGLDPEPRMIDVPFPPNTSFPGRASETAEVFRPAERVLITATAVVAGGIPRRLLARLRRPTPIPPIPVAAGSYSILRGLHEVDYVGW
jgi:hypothetical protein